MLTLGALANDDASFFNTIIILKADQRVQISARGHHSQTLKSSLSLQRKRVQISARGHHSQTLKSSLIVLKKDASSFAKAPSVNKVECCSE